MSRRPEPPVVDGLYGLGWHEGVKYIASAYGINTRDAATLIAELDARFERLEKLANYEMEMP